MNMNGYILEDKQRKCNIKSSPIKKALNRYISFDYNKGRTFALIAILKTTIIVIYRQSY